MERTNGVVVIDNEPFEIGAAHLYEARSLVFSWMISTEDSSLSDNISTYVATFITYARIKKYFICAVPDEVWYVCLLQIPIFSNLYQAECWNLEALV